MPTKNKTGTHIKRTIAVFKEELFYLNVKDSAGKRIYKNVKKLNIDSLEKYCSLLCLDGLNVNGRNEQEIRNFAIYIKNCMIEYRNNVSKNVEKINEKIDDKKTDEREVEATAVSGSPSKEAEPIEPCLFDMVKEKKPKKMKIKIKTVKKIKDITKDEEREVDAVFQSYKKFYKSLYKNAGEYYKDYKQYKNANDIKNANRMCGSMERLKEKFIEMINDITGNEIWNYKYITNNKIAKRLKEKLNTVVIKIDKFSKKFNRLPLPVVEHVEEEEEEEEVDELEECSDSDQEEEDEEPVVVEPVPPEGVSVVEPVVDISYDSDDDDYDESDIEDDDPPRVLTPEEIREQLDKFRDDEDEEDGVQFCFKGCDYKVLAQDLEIFNKKIHEVNAIQDQIANATVFKFNKGDIKYYEKRIEQIMEQMERFKI